MNIFAKLKEKKEQLKAYRMKKAENKAFTLEREAKESKEYASLIERQNKAKQQISEARRIEHPLLYKIGDNVKQNLIKNKEDKTYKKIAMPQNNVFGQKQGSNPFLQTGTTTPYYLKTKTKKPYWLK